MTVVGVSFFQRKIELNPDYQDKHFINWESVNRSEQINNGDFVKKRIYFILRRTGNKGGVTRTLEKCAKIC